MKLNNAVIISQWALIIETQILLWYNALFFKNKTTPDLNLTGFAFHFYPSLALNESSLKMEAQEGGPALAGLSLAKIQ